ncbi:YozD family protein [Bacillus pseudomycoides]
MVIIDDNEMAEFIQNELLKQGTIVKKEDILKMLSLVFEFLKLKGVAHD